MLAYEYLKRLRLNCHSFYLHSFHLCDYIILLISLFNVISNLFISLQPCLLMLCHDHWFIYLTLPTITVTTNLYFLGLVAKYHSSDRNQAIDNMLYIIIYHFFTIDKHLYTKPIKYSGIMVYTYLGNLTPILLLVSIAQNLAPIRIVSTNLFMKTLFFDLACKLNISPLLHFCP